MMANCAPTSSPPFNKADSDSKVQCCRRVANPMREQSDRRTVRTGKDVVQHGVGVGTDDFPGRFLFKRSPFNHALQKGDSSLQENGEIECRQDKGHVPKKDRPSVSLEHSDS